MTMNPTPLLPLLAAAILALPAPASATTPRQPPMSSPRRHHEGRLRRHLGRRRRGPRLGPLPLALAPGATLSPTGPGPGGAYARQIITPAEYAENAGAWLEENASTKSRSTG